MLTLTRKPGERIFIGNDIEILVKRIHEGEVRIGIAAPAGVKILRAELRETARPPEPRDCTCLGTCRGAAALAPGWRCARAAGSVALDILGAVVVVALATLLGLVFVGLWVRP